MPNRLMNLLLLLLLFAVIHRSAEALKCAACNKERCIKVLDCQWGMNSDVCGCCQICSQGPNEPCGGPWNIHGRCGTGLTCDKQRDEIPHSEGVCREDGEQEKLY